MTNEKILKQIVEEAIKTWGEELVCECHGEKHCVATIYYGKEIPAWQYHLQQMIQKVRVNK